MKRFTLFLAALLVSLIAPFALAAGTTANVAWTAPTQYTDGTTLPASDLASYTVTACEKASPSTCITANVPAPATTTTMTVVCGDYNFTVSATTSATATYPNETSASSNVVPYATGVSCAPKAVTGVTVN